MVKDAKELRTESVSLNVPKSGVCEQIIMAFAFITAKNRHIFRTCSNAEPSPDYQNQFIQH